MIVFDLDGTLADCEHRKSFIDPTKNICYMSHAPVYGHPDTRHKFCPDWDAFFEACDQDKLIFGTAMMFWACMRTSYMKFVRIWSGRSESVRQKTLTWLVEMLGIMAIGSFEEKIRDFDSILKMRPIGDYTPDDQLKERWLDEAIAKGNTIDVVFDDRPKVVRMWRRRGVFVFDCNQKGDEF